MQTRTVEIFSGGKLIRREGGNNVSHQNNQSGTNDVLNATQTSQSDEAVMGKLKLVQTPPATDHSRLTPEREATELRELIRVLQTHQPKKAAEPKQEDTLPPAA